MSRAHPVGAHPVELVAPRGGLVDVVVHVHLQPGARRTEVVGRYGDALKISVAAPASRGRANEACLEVLAHLLEVPVRALELETGPRSRSKRIRATGVERDTACRFAEMAR